MLESTLNIHHDIHIDTYMKLQAFLKRQKKAETFDPEEVEKFIEGASDQKFLLTKVTLIMGLMGACHCNEFDFMKIGDVQDYNGALIVNIPFTKPKKSRSFTVSDHQNGKCTTQKRGNNELASIGKQIATFLKPENSELYTDHCLRRSSALICASGGGDITAVKKMTEDGNQSLKAMERRNKTMRGIKRNDKSFTITSSNSNNSTIVTKNYELSENATPGIHFNSNVNNVTTNQYGNEH